MDPVNKWLMTIAGFMIALLIIISWKAGSGRYAFEVRDSQYFEKASIVYVLDTKDGIVRARMFLEEELITSDKRAPSRYPTTVFEKKRPVRRY